MIRHGYWRTQNHILRTLNVVHCGGLGLHQNFSEGPFSRGCHCFLGALPIKPIGQQYFSRQCCQVLDRARTASQAVTMHRACVTPMLILARRIWADQGIPGTTKHPRTARIYQPTGEMARNLYLQTDPYSRAWACEDEAFQSVLSNAVLYMLQAH